MNKRTLLILMVISFLALTVLAVAQMGPGMGRGYGMGPGMGRGYGMGSGMGQGYGMGHGWGNGGPGGRGLDYMTASLNLTDAQKQKAKSIFESAQKQAQTLRDQMYEKRKAYWNTVDSRSKRNISKKEIVAYAEELPSSRFSGTGAD